MDIKLISFPTNSYWIKGTIGTYIFDAKVYNEPSQFGINNGRVSKLSIRDKYKNPQEACVTGFDRGWFLKPNTEKEQHIFKTVLDYLEKTPKRFN